MKILIIGAGDVGFQLAKRLSTQKHDIVIIEMDPLKVERAHEQLDAFIIQGNGGSYRVLTEAGLITADIVAAMADRDEANLMSCRLAKKSGVETTIARVRDPQFTQPDFILSPEELGTDLIIHPEKETAEAVLHLIHKPSAQYAVELEDGRLDMFGVTLAPNSPLLNIPLRNLGEQIDTQNMRIVAINRNHDTIIPKGDDRLAQRRPGFCGMRP